ncbi:MAG: succinate--CoA ligase subunit alpha [Actinomycetales bacterium]|nr:succinate--CoA ligase subunit alpha [Actinomycetales bacterium]
MSIWLRRESRVIVQGMTGSEGRKHTQRMIYAGTNIVAGVTPGKGGMGKEFNDKVKKPVFDTVREAVNQVGADVSVIFVPASAARSAVLEAVDAEVPLIVVITEGIPVQDTLHVLAHARRKGVSRILGPNCPGLISPGRANVGIIPANITKHGPIGLVSKSGTLTYQLMFELKKIGFSTNVGIGGDPVVGTTHIDALAAFEEDPETRAICLIGEIGGDAEERAADFIRDHVSKPVVGYVAGFTAPEGRALGHAGAIVTGSSGTARAKREALEDAGVRVGRTPHETADLMRRVMRELG